ncbi:L-type lectin-domain containing receptor kinase IV.3 [Oryza sativa Japonica Group]|uniref:L-type lectin-domain containing receptor kinase IV.3 n=1 Tax=Oryza sativa subsp. japonica TaxID=39947 RepID=UPI00339C7712
MHDYSVSQSVGSQNFLPANRDKKPLQIDLLFRNSEIEFRQSNRQANKLAAPRRSDANTMLREPFHCFTLLLLLLAAADRCAAATGGSGGLQFAYDGFSGANLTLDGAATVTASGLLMLTNGSIQMKGHAFHPSPLPLRAARSFSTTFVFAIFGQYADFSSHGLAFFVSASADAFAAALPGQFLGLFNGTGATTGNRSAAGVFAVEFDTLFNAEFHDLNSNHVGVDVNSLTSVKAADAGYYDDVTGQFRNLTMISRKPMQAWVDYDGGSTEVTVAMAPLGTARPKKPLLRTNVDLSDVATGAAHVGFASATGILFSRHFVLGWSFAVDGPAPPLNISSLPPLPRAWPKPRSKVLEIVLPIASAALVAAVAMAVYAMARRRLRYAELREEWETAFGPHRFSYKDLFHATKGFSDKNLLGTGGFGSVYRGVLRKPDMEVAVKRVSHESRQGMKEFVAEVASIGRLRHRNLVQLLGYCRRKGELLLVYDYMPKGSLDKYLYDGSKHPLSWPQRFHIIRGVASGLLYLHEDWEHVVIHRDVKASNVLLDDEMNGRLGDFGLARLYDHGAVAQTTHVVGTMGYLAPELGHTGKATPSTDVFAFGAFLLEVTCGRRPIVQDEHGNRAVLVDWVTEQWSKGALVNVVDARIPSCFDPDEVSLVLKLGLLCSHPLPNARPTMRQVAQYLDGDMALPDLSPTYLSFTSLERMYKEFNRNSISYISSASGLAFVVAPTANLSAANAGQYLGFLNATNGTASGQILAVELDTIMNPEFHDISSNHVGIDANSLMSTQARPAGYYGDGDGAFRELRLNSRQPMQVWVDYDGQAKQLNVTLSPVQVPKPKKPLLSQAIDLSTVMAEEMYVGFSSATGVVNTHHYVLGWSFGFDGPAPPLDLSKLPRLPRFGPKPRSKVLDIVLPLATAFLVAAVLAAVFFVVRRRRRFAEVREDWEDEFGPHRFAYKDLFRATDGFKDRNLLGVGGFGRVYRGVLPESNLEIAVKRVSHDSRQGIREFVAEVVSIGRLRHRNLVQLLGYCRRKNELLLVYDYMANGSLDKYLHERNVTTLFWPERLWIIKGVASGLLYLHEDWEQVVIHRDIKASNVLLDSAMNGRLGDFGLARLYDHGTDPKTTHVVGTMGYLAPELVRTGKASPLTDVFAFGVFLLEVTCGRRPIETDEHNKRVVLVDLVLEHHRNGSIVGAADPRLTGKFDVEEVALVLKLGLLCSHPLPGARPSMRNVMQYLERGGKSAPDLSPSYVSYSMMAIMQNEGFDSFIMSGGPRSATSIGTVSGASSMTIMSEGR